jgi:hypothetical protein
MGLLVPRYWCENCRTFSKVRNAVAWSIGIAVAFPLVLLLVVFGPLFPFRFDMHPLVLIATAAVIAVILCLIAKAVASRNWFHYEPDGKGGI